MQQASWLVICGAAPWLFPGIYPSGIAHVVRPIVSIKPSGHKKIDLRYGTGLHDLVFARPLWATTASFSFSSSFSIFLREVELPSEDDDEKEDEDLAANYFLRCKEYGSPD